MDKLIKVTVVIGGGLTMHHFDDTATGQKKASLLVESIKKDFDKNYKDHPYTEVIKILRKWRDRFGRRSEEKKFDIRECLSQTPVKIPFHELKKMLFKSPGLEKYLTAEIVTLPPTIKVNIEKIINDEFYIDDLLY